MPAVFHLFVCLFFLADRPFSVLTGGVAGKKNIQHPLHTHRRKKKGGSGFYDFENGGELGLLPECTSIMPGHHQDKKRGEEENGATDGSQHPLATFCVREREKKKTESATEPVRMETREREREKRRNVKKIYQVLITITY